MKCPVISAPLIRLCMLVATFLFSFTVSAGDPVAAGVVTFQVGKVKVERKAQNGSQWVSLQEGAKIFEGDRLLTGEGAHLHIRFVDDGLLSVRPSSELRILHYSYDSGAPRDSLIKFELEKGNARSISGKGAKAARDKFRLNTPIAAIGVRGTDFVVSASTSVIRALVNEGAIVVSPFSDSCSKGGVGPCSSNGVELTGNDRYIIEYNNMLKEPQLVPLGDDSVPELMLEGENLVVTDQSSATKQVASVDGETDVTEQVEVQASNGSESELDELEELSQEPDWVVSERGSTQLDATAQENDGVEDYTPAFALSTDVLNQRQLVWGRWSGDVKPSDRVIADRSLITQGRKVAVGDLTYVLYRSGGDDSVMVPGLGQVSFQLTDAQAILNSGTADAALMSVESGALDIDFAQSRFATRLVLSHDLTSLVNVIAEGTVNSQGFFNSVSGAYFSENNVDFLTGAVSLDGSEASYLFKRQVEAGAIEGITYWNAQ